jgi:hypothetical protein
MALPPLRAIGKVQVEIWGPQKGSAKWDQAVWSTSVWSKFAWRNVTPQSMAVRANWGADDPVGVLTIPAAGSWLINTYDPQRLLDPSNGSSDFAVSIRPGKPIRISYIHSTLGTVIVRQGLIDEVDYDLTTKRGTLRGTDMVQLLVGATVAANQTGAPGTLRARAAWLISKVGLSTLITVEPTPVDETDPPVGTIDPSEASAWQHILTASLDALYAVWMDRTGILRFRSFGNPRDTGFQVGGADGIPISTVKPQGSLQGVYTRVTAFATSAPTVAVSASDAEKQKLYGDIPLKRDHPVPDVNAWVASVLADRAGASLQYETGTLYPQTEDALESILDLGMIDIAHLVVESVNPTLDVAPRVLGGAIIGDTGTGWTAELSTYVPASEWEQAEVPVPPEPPIEPPPNTTTVVRTYACTKDARLAHSSSLNAGNGQDINLPYGWISPYRNRVVLGFASIPWSKVVSVDKAELLCMTGAETCGAFGGDPKVVISRLTGSFSEGSYNVNCGFGTSNAVVYPGPSITSSGAVTSPMPNNPNNSKSIDITAIVRAWFGGQPQHGLMIKSAGEDSSKYTGAIYSRHHGTVANRPSLKLTLTVTP